MAASVLGQDAISVLALADPKLITEYMPVEVDTLVINLGVSRVYLGTSSSVSPSNGVPVDPGTGIPWIAHGDRTALYVVLDTGGTPGLVTITSNADGWTPSPAALAAEVAAELLVTGIPQVFVGAPITGGTITGNVTTIPITGYSTVNLGIAVGEIIALTPHPSPATFRVRQYSLFGPPGPSQTKTYFTDEFWPVYTQSCAIGGTFGVSDPQLLLSLPVRGDFMEITAIAPGGGTPTFYVCNAWGTNRQTPTSIVTNARGQFQMLATVAAGALITRLVDVFTNLDYAVLQGGPVQIRVGLPGTATLLAEFIDQNGNVQAQQVLSGTGNIDEIEYLPAGLIALYVQTTVAGSYNFFINTRQT